MDISLGEILSVTHGKALNAAPEAVMINRVSTDTRTLEAQDLFLALKGGHFDGHGFISDAIAKGAKAVILSDANAFSAEHKKSVPLIQVADTLVAYGDLARAVRQKFRIPAVAITGSSGKTTVKELISHLLLTQFQVLKNRGTENNLVGVPKTIFQLDRSHEVLVLEMGTSVPGEIDRLSSIVAPQIGIITQIGTAHLEGLKDKAGVREEKLKLLNHLERGGTLILNGEDPALADVKSGVHKILRVGFSKDGAEWTAERIWCHERGSSFYLNGKELCETLLVGRHNILNCLFALAVGQALGLALAPMQKALAGFKPVSGRLTLKTLEGVHFLDDTYNANPHSFKAALETLKDLKMREKKGIVCGDMLELGDHSEIWHRELGAIIAEMLFDFVIATGPKSKFLVDEALKRGFDPKRIHHVKDSQEAGRLCRKLVAPGDWVLVKGSRAMQMEKVFECFTPSSPP